MIFLGLLSLLGGLYREFLSFLLLSFGNSLSFISGFLSLDFFLILFGLFSFLTEGFSLGLLGFFIGLLGFSLSLLDFSFNLFGFLLLLTLLNLLLSFLLDLLVFLLLFDFGQFADSHDALLLAGLGLLPLEVLHASETLVGCGQLLHPVGNGFLVEVELNALVFNSDFLKKNKFKLII